MALQLFKIATTTVGSGGASNVDFTSIPQGYTDLKVVINARSNYAGAVEGVNVIVNNDTDTSNNAYIYLQGNGSAASTSINTASAYQQLGLQDAANNTVNTFGNMEIYIPNYTSSNYKSLSGDSVTEDNATTAYTRLAAGLYKSTNAITRLTFNVALGTSWSQYSTFTIYGIL
jgi:hypothetical protein